MRAGRPAPDPVQAGYRQNQPHECAIIPHPSGAGSPAGRETWLEDFRAELMQFPNGRHDDQVDSLSQFLACVEQRLRNRWAVQKFYL